MLLKTMKYSTGLTIDVCHSLKIMDVYWLIIRLDTNFHTRRRLFYHIITYHGDENTQSYIVRSNDTDVLLHLVYHVAIHNTTNVWIYAGLDGNNTRRYIHVSSMSTALGSKKAVLH